MVEKVINSLKEQPFYIPNILLKNYRKLDITDSELIVLIYIINTDDTFNPKQICNDLNFELEEIMNLMVSLTDKGILKIDVIVKKVREEVINLDNLYTKLAYLIVNEKQDNQDTTIFEIIEKEFGRTLSAMEYEIITAWQTMYQDELIEAALKEAIFNNAKNLKYIDRILDNWDKQGIKSKEELNKNQNNKIEEQKKSNKKLFDYDWINERDS